MTRLTVDEETLSHNIGQLFDALIEFKNLLLKEAELLKSYDFETLPELLDHKSKLSGQIEQQFFTLTSCFDHPAPQKLDALLNEPAFLGVQMPIQKSFIDLITLINECHDLNLVNGIIVQTLSNMNQVSLNILTGQTSSSGQIYSATGERQNSKKQTSLGKA